MFRTWYLIKYLLFLVSWNFVFSQEPSPAAAPRPAPAPAAAGVARNAVVEEAEVVLPLASERIDDVEVLEELMGRQLSVTGQFTLYDFSKRYHCLSSVTERFYDGHRRVINDFQVPSMFKDNFRVLLSRNKDTFHLPTCINPTLLNAADRAEQEFDPDNRDTLTIVSSIHQTVNVIANDLGTDFDNLWSEGTEYKLPFVCNPLPHVGIVRQFGDPAL
jgi:hypothetical protein